MRGRENHRERRMNREAGESEGKARERRVSGINAKAQA